MLACPPSFRLILTRSARFVRASSGSASSNSSCPMTRVENMPVITHEMGVITHGNGVFTHEKPVFPICSGSCSRSKRLPHRCAADFDSNMQPIETKRDPRKVRGVTGSPPRAGRILFWDRPAPFLSTVITVHLLPLSRSRVYLDIMIPNSGWIEAICGPMFSGKSEELIRRLRRAAIARKRVQAFKPAIDNRYSESEIVSHGDVRMRSESVDTAE